MTVPAHHLAPFPRWVASLDAPIWVTGPDGTVHWINHQAATLLAVSSAMVLGGPCCEAMAAEPKPGRPFCAPGCPAFELLRRGLSLPLFRVRVGSGNGSDSDRWIRVLLIPVRRGRDGATFLVHCVVSTDLETRMERYLQRVAERWTPHRVSSPPSATVALTGREKQILDLLAQDEDLHSIAGRLAVRYVTVRNHVQHILNKLGVHSIQEAVARSLIT